MKFSIILILCLIANFGFCQLEIIPTGTTTSISELKKNGNRIVMSGWYDFFATCTGDCQDLHVVTTPGPQGYDNLNLNLIDISTYFINSENGVVPFRNVISKTTDGGETWEVFLDTMAAKMVSTVIAFDTASVYSHMTGGGWFYTHNSGETWITGSNPGAIYYSAYLTLNDSTAIAGRLQGVSITKNKGVTWSGVGFAQAEPLDFAAKNSDSLFAVSIGGSGSYFSYNFSGNSSLWTHKSMAGYGPHGIAYLSDSEIYVVAENGYTGKACIMKTADFGQTWGIFNTDFTERLLDIEFVNDSIALIAGSNGLLLRWNKNSPMEYLDLSENVLSGKISLFPNPSCSDVTIKLPPVSEVVTVTIFDTHGRLVRKAHEGVLGGDPALLLNVSDLTNGMYIFNITIGDHKESLRFIKN